jgi:uncharacterized membrane protein (GlpM family)
VIATFLTRLILSFITGATWVTLSTLAAERFGSKLGGLIGGMPSTVVVSLLFIGLTQTPELAAQAATLVPVTMGVDGLFVVAYLLTVRQGLAAGMWSGLAVWLVLASLLVAGGIQSSWISFSGWLVLSLISYLWVEKGMKIVSQGRVRVKYTPIQIGGRALFGGTVIACAVLAGRLGGPLVGGIFATFPAMFISTLTITYRTGGVEFARAVAKTLMVSGLINVPIYALAVRFAYPWVGLAYGTVLALLISAISGYLTLLFVRERLA